ncbi:MAG: hypothetical protein F3743_07520 [Nitrospinae bacterium]|nr:hypothetical protein [Nitrospinota bacterium]
MFENNKYKKCLEALFWEINKAVIESEDVRNLILEIERTGKLDSASDYNLVLDVRLLIETVKRQGKPDGDKQDYMEEIKRLIDSFDDEIEDERQSSSQGLTESPNFEKPDETNLSKHASKGAPVQWIDGKVLSEKEIQFQEFVNSNFDESSWLKQARICYKH